ncbi:MAG: hypothetical protein MMC23_007437 [Stictis urceolatum]|nr:hypothetical protein [Stictis urceolata]
MELATSNLESSVRHLFRRCVQCPDTQPACPPCGESQMCSFITQTCNACASTKCVDKSSVDNSSANASSSGKSAAGPIAGAVVGGVVLIGLITFLVWKFCVSKRRGRNANNNEWPDSQMGSEKDGGMERFSMQRDHRASTHTVGSVASTVFTRASNIIQIAYIPGVTNRSLHSSPDLVPPVPPIPAASAGGSGPNTPHINSEDQHFFMPSDLRNSKFSEFSDRNSMATRNSIASTMYRNNAIVSPVPAQMASRGKATAVSVRSDRNSPNMSRSTTPPVPSLPGSTVAPTLNTKSSIVGRVGQPRSVQITRKASTTHSPIYELDGSGSEASCSPYMTVPDRKFDNVSPQYSHHSSAFDDASSDEEYGNNSSRAAGRRLISKSRRSEATTIQEESLISQAELSSYQNSENLDVARNTHKKSPSLNQIIEEAARNASRDPLHGGLGSYEHEQPIVSPFADAHAARTP